MTNFAHGWLSSRLGSSMLFVSLAIAVTSPVSAQEGSGFGFDNITFPAGGLGGESAGEIRLKARIVPTGQPNLGWLQIHAELSPGWHVYSVNQPGDSVPPLRVVLEPSENFRKITNFQEDKAPHVRNVEVFDDPLHEHYDNVTLSAQISVVDGASLASMKISGHLTGQVCHDELGCIPLDAENARFVATYVDSVQAGAAGDRPPVHQPTRQTIDNYEPFRIPGTRAELSGKVVAGSPKGGWKLQITITPDQDWHVYPLAEKDPKVEGSKPTLIVITESSGLQFGEFISQNPVVEGPPLAEGAPKQTYHKGPVTWTATVSLPADQEAKNLAVEGIIGYQLCTDETCDRPLGAKFSALVGVGPNGGIAAKPVQFEASRYKAADDAADATADAAQGDPTGDETGGLDLKQLQENVAAQNQWTNWPIWYILPFAFFGGLILNVMPCVLPVIGLKVMSFVSQGGEDRRRVFALNLWYSAGLISVFLVLAGVAVIWNVVYQTSFGWGQQFNFPVYTISLSAIVFVMGLSFLGVWEIPIPGFATGKTASDLAAKEGPAGAFAKGIVTTLLATPCSGPGIAVALAWCQGKPPLLVFSVFAMLGIGMSSPYLLIGAYPNLVKFLPKPGEWMETFKQIMGFALLGTVVFLFYFMDWVYMVPTLAFLVGLWAACWWIGRTPMTAEFPVRMRAWLVAGVLGAVVGLWSFSGGFEVAGFPIPGLYGIMNKRFDATIDKQISQREEAIAQLEENSNEPTKDFELPWQAFSFDKLSELTDQNKTVLVDFTASWCLTCKTLEQFVLNTQDVREVVDENGVVPLMADWSNRDPEIGNLLESLGSKQVPLLAIFPAGKPNDPIVLIGGYSKSKLIGKLREAGPSQPSVAEHTALVSEKNSNVAR